jgi:hypothetical protein
MLPTSSSNPPKLIPEIPISFLVKSSQINPGNPDQFSPPQMDLMSPHLLSPVSTNRGSY